MKLQLIGHDERYVVEQSLMAPVPRRAAGIQSHHPGRTQLGRSSPWNRRKSAAGVIVELAYQGRKAAQCVAFHPGWHGV